MRTMRLSDAAEGPVLVEEYVPRPQPGKEDLLVRVHAVGVTSKELIWYPTTHNKSGETRSRAVPCHEFSGVVAAIGEGAAGFAVGQEVFGMNDWFADGATAEFCLTQPTSVAPKPVTLTHAEAASVPIGALTAWQGLFDRARLQSGERLLVHGGAGAVGVFAIQLARRHGAHVTTTASARNRSFVSELGAQLIIDYQSVRFEEQAREMDVIFNTVGGETLARSWSVLKPGGRLLTIAADSETTIDEHVKEGFFIVEANQSQLVRIGAMLDAGELRTFVDAVLPFARAAEAYGENVNARHGRGKVVIAIEPT
jgi:NADPH:quinone reductase-like Zn-dependent oxidoreductase